MRRGWATLSDAVSNRAELDAILAERFNRSTSDTLIALLDGAGIANARMNTVRELAEHPQLVERGRWHAVGSPVGPIQALSPPVLMEGVDPVMNPVPTVGEHTDRILGEIGLDRDTIATWRRSGII